MTLFSLFLNKYVNIVILFFEYTGVTVMLISGVKGAYDCFVKKCPETRINLAKGMATALEFKMGSEILRTAIAHELKEIIFIGGIIVLRAALAFLIHWEIKNEEARSESCLTSPSETHESSK